MGKDSIVVRPLVCIWLIAILVSIHILASLTNVPAFLQLFLQSVICVYLGCFLSAKIKQNKKDKVAMRLKKADDQETMSSKDAYMFPVYGSIALFSIYCAYKFLPKEWLNIVFTCHFTFIGLFCLANFIELPVSKFISEKMSDVTVIDKKINIDLKFFKKEIPINLNYIEAICLAISLFPAIIYATSKHWITNNIFGIAFSIVGIESLNLPNFKTGFILLWGLFFYDIFWVYGTDVMVTVAKSFDAPIKLMFPYQWETDGETPGPKFSMLGLGDIVIPGIFVALCLKYDFDRRLKNTKNVHNVKTPLFNFCFGGYVLGIITTYVVMVVFKHAQPALLFLVPGCTGGVLIRCLLDGSLKDVFNYNEEDGREPDETPKDKSKVSQVEAEKEKKE